MQPITVLLAEDHLIVREGLRALLRDKTDIQVIGEAEDGRQAVELTGKLRPAVIVMDIAMPLLNGLEATRQILKNFPGTRVIILSAHGADPYVEQVVKVGAAGFLLKQTSADMLATAIRTVNEGGNFFSSEVSRRLQERARSALDRTGKPRKKPVHLTSREVEVLQLIAEGKPNKLIADELGISFKGVDKHRQHLMAKLNIHDAAGLTRYAISAGIIEISVPAAIT